MFELAGRAIGACWVLFVIVWIIAARFTKRTVARSQTWLRWILAIVAVESSFSKLRLFRISEYLATAFVICVTAMITQLIHL